MSAVRRKRRPPSTATLLVASIRRNRPPTPIAPPRTETVAIWADMGETFNDTIRSAAAHFRYQAIKKKLLGAVLATRPERIATFARPVTLLFVPLHKRGDRLYDCLNHAHIAKAIEDWLVQTGVLINDSPDYVRAITIGHPRHNDRAGFLVTINELDLAPASQQAALEIPEPEEDAPF